MFRAVLGYHVEGVSACSAIVRLVREASSAWSLLQTSCMERRSGFSTVLLPASQSTRTSLSQSGAQAVLGTVRARSGDCAA